MLQNPIGRLLIIDKEGENFVECILDSQVVTLGRNPDCNIKINSRAVSRVSAVFEYNADTNSTWVTSFGSNLITVDKHELAHEQPCELKPGALIEVQVADHTRTMVYQLMDETMVIPECCAGLMEQTLPLQAINTAAASTPNQAASATKKSATKKRAAPAPPPPPPAMPPLKINKPAPVINTAAATMTTTAPPANPMTGFIADPAELLRLRQGLRPVQAPQDPSSPAAPSPPAAIATAATTKSKRKSVRFMTIPLAAGTPEGNIHDATVALGDVQYSAQQAGAPAVDVMADSTMAFAQWAMGTSMGDTTKQGESATPTSRPMPLSSHKRSSRVHSRVSTPMVPRGGVSPANSTPKSTPLGSMSGSPRIMIAAASSPKPSSVGKHHGGSVTKSTGKPASSSKVMGGGGTPVATTPALSTKGRTPATVQAGAPGSGGAARGTVMQSTRRKSRLARTSRRTPAGDEEENATVVLGEATMQFVQGMVQGAIAAGVAAATEEDTNNGCDGATGVLPISWDAALIKDVEDPEPSQCLDDGLVEGEHIAALPQEDMEGEGAVQKQVDDVVDAAEQAEEMIVDGSEEVVDRAQDMEQDMEKDMMEQDVVEEEVQGIEEPEEPGQQEPTEVLPIDAASVEEYAAAVEDAEAEEDDEATQGAAGDTAPQVDTTAALPTMEEGETVAEGGNAQQHDAAGMEAVVHEEEVQGVVQEEEVEELLAGLQQEQQAAPILEASTRSALHVAHMYRIRAKKLQAKVQTLTRVNKLLRDRNKALSLQLMMSDAFVQAADLDDVAGSDYQPSPVPASEVYATDDELDLADEEEEEQEEEVSRMAIIRKGAVRTAGDSPASVAPRSTMTAHTAPPSAAPPAAQPTMSTAATGPAPPSVTRSSKKGPMSAIASRTPMAPSPAVSGAFTVGDLFQSAVKAGASPQEALELVEQAFEMEQQEGVVDKKQQDEEDTDTDCEAEEEAPEVCITCKSVEEGDVLLLCDGCDAPHHLGCAGLAKVPRGKWYCGECSAARVKAAPARRGTRAAAKVTSKEDKVEPETKPTAQRKGRSKVAPSKATATETAAPPARKRRNGKQQENAVDQEEQQAQPPPAKKSRRGAPVEEAVLGDATNKKAAATTRQGRGGKQKSSAAEATKAAPATRVTRRSARA